MTLTDIQAKEILYSPNHKRELNYVKHQESALRVFTEELDEHEIQYEYYWKKLQSVIKKRVGKKYERVCDFIRFPLPVVEITDSILGDFYRVFDGKNKEFNIQADRDLTRLNNWINEKNLVQWIEDNAKQVWKNKPCSFVVIDSDGDNPVCILIDKERIIDAELKKDESGELEYIAFMHSVKTDEETKKKVERYAVYDDVNYHVFIKDDQGDFIKDEELSGTHDIGYCPATTFIRESNNSINQYKRRTAFSSAMSKLEDWLIFDIFRNYVDHYAPFPVTESVVSRCANPSCDSGVIKREETILDGPKKGTKRTIVSKCNICEGRGTMTQYVGPGTHIGIKHQTNPQVNDGSGKFKMIFPDVDKLKYTPQKLDDIELEVRFKTVGVNTMINKEAINEMQAKGSFLSMETVLLRNKVVLDKLYEFIAATVAKMFYRNINIQVSANFGTEWYLMSEEQLQKLFDNAKKIGLPNNEVVSIYKQLLETKYSNNQSKREREIMLVDLQDYPFYSLEELIKLKNESVLDDFQLSLETNFYAFVKRFEIENGEITMFGLNLDYMTRIKVIKETLSAYNQELINGKIVRNNPEATGDEVVVTQEQLDAQANLRGTVGGVQGILLIQQGIAAGTTSQESAIATMVEIYGFSEAKASEILGVSSIPTIPIPIVPAPTEE